MLRDENETACFPFWTVSSTSLIEPSLVTALEFALSVALVSAIVVFTLVARWAESRPQRTARGPR